MDMDSEKVFLFSSSILVGVVCFLMVSSVLSYLLTGILLAFVSYPVYEKISNRLERNISAFLVVFLTVLIAILPFTVLVGVVGGEAADLVSNVDLESVQSIESLEEFVLTYTGEDIDIESRAEQALRGIAGILPSGLSSAISLVSSVSIGITLMLFLQFYTLRDGKRFINWTKNFNFLDNERQEYLYSSTARATWSIVKGHVSIAFFQGFIAGIGLWIAGIPSVFFWTFMMIILGFIPMIGTALIWVPAAIYLIINGSIYMGLFLLFYGMIIVGATDNILRPIVIDEESGIHPFLILLGLIGGVGIFGPVGLFLGPVIFGIFKTLLDMIQESRE